MTDVMHCTKMIVLLRLILIVIYWNRIKVKGEK
jgi:hypothetical protein